MGPTTIFGVDAGRLRRQSQQGFVHTLNDLDGRVCRHATELLCDAVGPTHRDGIDARAGTKAKMQPVVTV